MSSWVTGLISKPVSVATMKIFNLMYLYVFIVSIVLVGCTDNESSVSSHLEQGKTFLESGDYKKASIEFKNVLQIDTKNVEAYVFLAKAEEADNNWKNAFINYTKAIELDPNNLEAHVMLGRIYQLSGDHEAAGRQMEIVLSIDSENYHGLMLNAVALVKKKEFDAAIVVIKKILSSHPEKREATALLANIYVRQNNRLSKAADVIVTGLSHNKDNVQLLVQLAQIYVAALKMDDAENTLKKIISIEPEELQHRINLASFYVINKNLIEAEYVLREAIRLKPDDENRYLLLVDFLEKNKNGTIAEDELINVVNRMPNSIVLRFSLSVLFDRNSKTADAIRQYEHIIKIDGLTPDALRARNLLAKLLLRERRQAEASLYIDEVLSNNPNDNDALKLKGQLALSVRDPATAIIYFRQVRKDQPESFEVVNLLATSHAMNNEREMSIQVLQRFLDLMPNSVVAMLTLSKYLIQLGEYDVALDQLDKVLINDESNILALQLKSDALLAKQEVDAALMLLKKIQKLYPDNVENYKHLGDLYFKQGKYTLAIDAYEQALRISGKQLPYMASIVRSYLQAKKPDEAKKYIEQKLSTSSDVAVLYGLLAEVYIFTKQYEEAKATLEKAIILKSDWNLLYSSLAKIQTMQGNPRLAVNTYNLGLKRIPDDERLSTELAGIYENHYEYDKAIKLYMNVLVKNPGNHLAVNNLALILANYKDSEVDKKRALKIAEVFESSNNPVYLDTLGWVLYKNGQLNKAVQLLNKSVDAAPDVPHFNYHLGMVYDALGNPLAKKYLTAAVQSELNFPGRQEAAAALRRYR